MGLDSFANVLAGITSIVDTRKYGMEGTRHGLVVFDADVNLAVNFDEFDDKADFLARLDVSVYGGSGSADLEAVLAFVDEYIQSSSNQLRPDSQLKIVLLLDSKFQ